MATQDLPQYLTLKQACELLQVHPNTFRNWDRTGILKAVQIGEHKLRRYKKEDVITFTEQS